MARYVVTTDGGTPVTVDGPDAHAAAHAIANAMAEVTAIIPGHQYLADRAVLTVHSGHPCRIVTVVAQTFSSYVDTTYPDRP